MNRLSLFSIVVGALAFVGCASTAAAPFVRGPYSGAPSATSIVISWILAAPAPATLEVAPRGPAETLDTFPRALQVPSADPDARGQVDALVTDLEPATTYVYRVIVQSGSNIISSPIGHFRTEPDSDQAVTFAVLSDTQRQGQGIDRLAVTADAIACDSARSGGFDFVLHAGDLVEAPDDADWDAWFASFEPMLLAAPFVPVLGNHEDNSTSYYAAFSHPAGAGQNDERWWTLRWGDTLVVGLDTSATRADRILEQQAYARIQLSGPERWKFVVLHHPVFSSDADHNISYRFDEIYHPIFVETGVDLVFSGHSHNYERVERDGVVYLVLGGGGAVPLEFATARVEGSAAATDGHNFYARVSTTPDEVSVNIVSVAEATATTFVPTPGELLDSFVLCAPASP
jgi:predicted phosphodiesterase